MQAPIVHVPSEVDGEAFLDALQSQGVQIPAREAVLSYLSEHPELTTLIAQAVDALRERFPSITLTLQYYQDPEIEEDEFLVLLTRMEDYPADFGMVFDSIRTALLTSSPEAVNLHITTDWGRE